MIEGVSRATRLTAVPLLLAVVACSSSSALGPPGDLGGVNDTLVHSDFPSLGVTVAAGQLLRLRVYPYYTSGSPSGKSLMLANIVVSGVTN